MLSLRTMFSPAAAVGERGRIQLRLDDQSFFWTLANGQVGIGRGEIADADAVVTGSPMAIASIVYGGRPLGDAISADDLAVEGDADLVRRLPTFFPLPEPAPDRVS